MEPEKNNETILLEVKEKSSLHTVTTLSKYLAMALFVALPFIGGWIGYQYAPDKVIEVDKVVIQEVETIIKEDIAEENAVLGIDNEEQYKNNDSLEVGEVTSDWNTYTNDEVGFSFKYPSEYKIIIPENDYPPVYIEGNKQLVYLFLDTNETKGALPGLYIESNSNKLTLAEERRDWLQYPYVYEFIDLNINGLDGFAFSTTEEGRSELRIVTEKFIIVFSNYYGWKKEDIIDSFEIL